MHMRNGGTIFNKHDYVVDSAHRRTKQTRTDDSYVNYTYDPASQLRTAEGFTSGGSPITTEQLRYGYDEAQNMVKRTNHTSVATYTVNSRNQVTSDGGATYTYDNNGNRTYLLQMNQTLGAAYRYDAYSRTLTVLSGNVCKGHKRLTRPNGAMHTSPRCNLGDEARHLHAF